MREPPMVSGGCLGAKASEPTQPTKFPATVYCPTDLFILPFIWEEICFHCKKRGSMLYQCKCVNKKNLENKIYFEQRKEVD